MFQVDCGKGSLNGRKLQMGRQSRVRQKVRVNANAVRFGETTLNTLEYEAYPLTPALTPLWRGEGDGERFEHLTLTRNRTLRIESDSNVIGSG